MAESNIERAIKRSDNDVMMIEIDATSAEATMYSTRAIVVLLSALLREIADLHEDIRGLRKDVVNK